MRIIRAILAFLAIYWLWPVVGIVLIIAIALASWAGCKGTNARQDIFDAKVAAEAAETAAKGAETSAQKAAGAAEAAKTAAESAKTAAEGTKTAVDQLGAKVDRLRLPSPPPAPAPAPSPVAPASPAPIAPPPPAPASPAASAAPTRVLEELMEDFKSSNTEAAKMAARRISQRDDAGPVLVELYAGGSKELKDKVIWTMYYWPAQARQYVLELVNNPAPYRVTLASAAKEIFAGVEAIIAASTAPRVVKEVVVKETRVIVEKPTVVRVEVPAPSPPPAMLVPAPDGQFYFPRDGAVYSSP